MITYYIFLFSSLLPSISETPQFEAQTIDNNVSIGYNLAIGDVDGDKKPDILLADKKQFVWYRNGDWKRFVMVDSLTEFDNVCIAARDLDGDGKVEVAVGAQWNPSETSDISKSGAVYYLIRPSDPTKLWTPVALHPEPTVHRMKWAKTPGNKYHLIMLPLHGKGNKNGEGEGVKVIAYEMPKDASGEWKYRVIDQSMHLTHNFDVIDNGKSESFYIGGKEGLRLYSFDGNDWSLNRQPIISDKSFGEVRIGNSGNQRFITGIEPMHGNELSVYTIRDASPRVPLHQPNLVRTVLTSELNQGHALAVSNLVGAGRDQVIVGWREPNKDNKVGIKIFVSEKNAANKWNEFWIDDNGIACEDIQIADLDSDGKKDIIASGRSTHNLKIYWNKN